MSDESDPPENPPPSLIPRSAGGTPPPQRRPSRAPQTPRPPITEFPPRPRASASPNVPPKRPSTPTTPPSPSAWASTPATAGAIRPSTPTNPPRPPPPPSPQKPRPRPTSPPIDLLMPTPKQPLAVPSSAGFMVKMLFGFGFLLVLTYSFLVAFNPKARDWATSGDGPTPFNFVNEILALPARLVGKTKDVVAANDARVGVLDRVIATDAKGTAGAAGKTLTDPFGPPVGTPGMSAARAAAAAGEEPDIDRVSREALLALAAKDTAEVAPPEPVAPSPTVTEAPPAPGPTELKLPGGVVIANRSPEGAPLASRAFMYWVASLTVSGVSNSTPARFLMNGRVVREGDEANKPLGITVNHVDAAARLIYFQDKAGAVVTRSY